MKEVSAIERETYSGRRAQWGRERYARREPFKSTTAVVSLANTAAITHDNSGPFIFVSPRTRLPNTGSARLFRLRSGLALGAKSALDDSGKQKRRTGSTVVVKRPHQDNKKIRRSAEKILLNVGGEDSCQPRNLQRQEKPTFHILTPLFLELRFSEPWQRSWRSACCSAQPPLPRSNQLLSWEG